LGIWGFYVEQLNRLFQSAIVEEYVGYLVQGDLAWVISGIRHDICLVLEVDGSPYHKNISDFKYIVLHDGIIKEYRGWNLEKIIND
tara:strand:- start:812 stop:1069 length:258 start_codon:yes stop_codon:yes gene_type:complete